MKTTLWAIAAIAALGAGSVEAKTIRMEVDGMVCAFCAQGIEKKLRAMAPAKDVFVSLEKKVVAVALKDGQDIPDATLAESIRDAGYAVKGIARVDDSLESIRKAARAK